MSFNHRDIRPAMDVYTLDNHYLGTVLAVLPGNPEPRAQSTAAHYGARAAAEGTLGQGMIRVGKWWGLWQRRLIPMAAIQTVSLERIVLRWKREDISATLPD